MSLFCGHCGTQLPKGKRTHDAGECRDELETQRDRSRSALEAAEP